MTTLAERVRRVRGRATGHLRSLPILALVVHEACNCRCVMCDIWKANAEGRSLDPAMLDTHVEALRRLRVQRVMLTGGEPLLHRNLWALCDRLRAEGIALTLVTTGLLAERDAAEIATRIDTVVMSVDGPPVVHDAVRRVPRGFARLAAGVAALAGQPTKPRLIARSVVQRANAAVLPATVQAAEAAGFDEISFLAADLTSTAFNRADPWSASRSADVAVPAADLPALAAAIQRTARDCRDALARGFVVGGLASLDRVHAYYAAAAGLGPFPRVRCNAPWISAVLEPGGAVRPCFFLPGYEPVDGDVEAVLNAPGAIERRRALDVATSETCQRCVCSLYLPDGRDVGDSDRPGNDA